MKIIKEYKANKLVVNLQLDKFLKLMMKGGNYAKVFNKVYLILVLIKESKISKKPVKFFESSILRAGPAFCLKTQKKSGHTYFIPSPCRYRKKIFLGTRFLLDGAKQACKREGLDFSYSLINELSNLYNKDKYSSYTLRKKKEYFNNVLRYKNSVRFLKKF